MGRKIDSHDSPRSSRFAPINGNSILFRGDHQIKDQHRRLPLSALLRPNPIPPTDIDINYPETLALQTWEDIAINYSHKIGTVDTAGGFNAPPVTGKVS